MKQNEKLEGVLLWLEIIARGVHVLVILLFLIAYLYVKLVTIRFTWKVRFRLRTRGLPKDLRKHLYISYNETLKNLFPSPLNLLRQSRRILR